MAVLDFRFVEDKDKNERWVETSLSGKPLLSTPQLNKGTAFSEAERYAFDLLGKLPVQIETLSQQSLRAYEQFQGFVSDFQRHIYLNSLHDTNQVLFYRLVMDHLEEMLPLIYTPHVGIVVKTFSQQFRRPRGLQIPYEYRNDIKTFLNNRSNPNVDIIVVTDGEAVLGIGDQGAGSINIPIAKLMVYTLCAGINPAKTLPITLDVGTDNEVLLNDPLYLGCRHKRIRGKEYNEFIKQFITAVQEIFPNVLLHWEDCAAEPARQNLTLCQNNVCSFNDDIQGTAVAVIATIIAALAVLKEKLTDQRIVIFGAGTAGMGIAEQIHATMIRQGLDRHAAYKHFWLIDKQGLLSNDSAKLAAGQKPYARPANELKDFPKDASGYIGLEQTVAHVKPTILIGCSSVTGAFTKDIVSKLAANVARPIILPLSNPTTSAEAHPEDLLRWTQGKALIATGSPFKPITYKHKKMPIAQCNNAVAFPGIGLGAVIAQAKTITDEMLFAASDVLSKCAPALTEPYGMLLPPFTQSRITAKIIAIAVAKTAREQGLAGIADGVDIEQAIDEYTWAPHYLPMRRKP